MKKVVRRRAEDKLDEPHAVAEIVRAKVIADLASAYQTIFSKESLAQNPILEGAMLAAAGGFATRVERCNYLPQGDLILRAEGDSGVQHAWDLHGDLLGPLTLHMDTLKQMGVTIKDFPIIFRDAKEVLRVAVASLQ